MLRLAVGRDGRPVSPTPLFGTPRRPLESAVGGNRSRFIDAEFAFAGASSAAGVRSARAVERQPLGGGCATRRSPPLLEWLQGGSFSHWHKDFSMRTLFSRFCTLALGLTLAADALRRAPQHLRSLANRLLGGPDDLLRRVPRRCPSEPIAAYLIGESTIGRSNADRPACQWEKEVTALKAGDPTQTAGGLVLSRKWHGTADRRVRHAGRPGPPLLRAGRPHGGRFDHDGLASTPDKFAYCYLYHCNPKALGGLNESKFMTFGFEALEAPTDAKPAKVKGRIQNAAVHVEHEGTTYVIQLRVTVLSSILTKLNSPGPPVLRGRPGLLFVGTGHPSDQTTSPRKNMDLRQWGAATWVPLLRSDRGEVQILADESPARGRQVQGRPTRSPILLYRRWRR